MSKIWCLVGFLLFSISNCFFGRFYRNENAIRVKLCLVFKSRDWAWVAGTFLEALRSDLFTVNISQIHC